MTAVSRITWPRSSFVGFDRIWNELDTALTNSVDQTNVSSLDTTSSRSLMSLISSNWHLLDMTTTT